MRSLRPISLLLCLMWTAGAGAQISLSPPGAESPSVQPVKAKPKPPAKKPAAAPIAPKPAPAPAPAATVTPAPLPDDPTVDTVYAAYQRGMYKTAFDLA